MLQSESGEGLEQTVYNLSPHVTTWQCDFNLK